VWFGLRALVTGGAGFIGRNLVRNLVANEQDVVILDNFSLSDMAYLREFEAAKIIKGDVRREADVFEAAKGCSVIYHLAAPSSMLMYEENPIESSIVTVQGFLNVLEAMRRFDVKRLVYASTAAVYEGNRLPYKEDMEIRPPDHKALMKKFNEETAQLYIDRYGLSAVGLRPFSVYGSGEKSKGRYANVASLFTWSMLRGERPILWGDGAQTRDFIFIDDVVEAFMLAGESTCRNEIFNVGTGIETSFNEIVSILNRELGLNLEPVYVPIPISIYARRLRADISKARDELGFIAKTPLLEGIRAVIRQGKSGQALSHL